MEIPQWQKARRQPTPILPILPHPSSIALLPAAWAQSRHATSQSQPKAAGSLSETWNIRGDICSQECEFLTSHVLHISHICSLTLSMHSSATGQPCSRCACLQMLWEHLQTQKAHGGSQLYLWAGHSQHGLWRGHKTGSAVCRPLLSLWNSGKGNQQIFTA